MGAPSAEPAVPPDPVHPSADALPPARSVGRLTLLVLAAAALGLFVFEATKTAIFPRMTLWESHTLTIVFGSAVAALGARRALAAQAALHVRVLAEHAERVRAESHAASLRESEARFRQLVEQSPEAIVVHDAARVLYANPACLRLLGAPSLEAAPTLELLSYLHDDDRALAAERLGRLARGAEGTYAGGAHAGGAYAEAGEYRVRALDGGERVVDAASVPVTHDGAPAVQTVLRDVTTRKALEAQLTHRAFHDALTGLANRALFRDRVAHALARLGRGPAPEGERVAALLIDLDHFKRVNDSLGHAAGDLLLAAVAQRLLAATRGCDTVARLGGDEFGVLLERMHHDDDARRVADRALASLRAPFAVDGREVTVGASVGIAYTADLPAEATGADGTEGADALVRNADLALYAAKAQGRFRHATYAPAMHAAALARLELEGELRAAVALAEAGRAADAGLALAYQPIVDLATGRAAGVEALLRWRPPGRAPVPPARLVPVAEDTGLIVPLGRWVLGEACRQLAAWDAQGVPPLHLSVNVSGRQLQDPGLVGDAAAALAAARLAPARLVLEITETVMMHDAAATLARLRALKALGLRLAIDDFGTGYSSLAYLRQFPVDVLKIDKTFVDGVGHGGDESVLATAIVTLGAALSLTTVAEGIEDAAQLTRLRALGCARGQGYFFARPMPALDVPAWLAARALPAAA